VGITWRVFDQYQIYQSTEDGKKYILRTPVPGNIGHVMYPYIAKKGSRHKGQPYLSTENQLRVDVEDLLKLDKNLNDDAAILTFVHKYGLLGLLHHTVSDILLWPHLIEHPDLPQILVVRHDLYINAKDSWHNPIYPFPEIDRTYINRKYYPDNVKAHNDNDPVPWKVSYGGKGKEDYDLFTDIDNSYVIKKDHVFASKTDKYPLAQGLKEFFPILFRSPDEPEHSRSEYRYPLPLSPEFWVRYGENLDTFKSTIHELVAIMTVLPNLEPREGMDQAELNKQEALQYKESSDLNNAIDAWPMSSIVDGKVTETIGFTSMIGLLAYAVMESLSRGSGIKNCIRYSNRTGYCHIPFIEGTKGTLYCCKRCKSADTTRRADERKKTPMIER
jgi:hypothetical protein